MHAILLCDTATDWLSPLSSFPQALLPLCGKPLLAHILAYMEAGGIRQVLLITADATIPRQLGTHFGALTLDYADTLPPRTSHLTLFLTALHLFRADYTALQAAHQQTDTEVTLLTFRTDFLHTHPKLLEEDGAILAVSASHPSADVRAQQTFSGAAILSPDLPLHQDFLRSIPHYRTRSTVLSGKWYPITTANEYLTCQRALLQQLPGNVLTRQSARPEAILRAPVLLGDNVKIGTESTLSGCVIGNNVTIGSGTQLEDCVILDGAYIGNHADCLHSVIFGNAMLMNGCRLDPYAMIGEGANIGERAEIGAHVRVFSGKRVPPNAKVEFDVRHHVPAALALEEDGICGELSPHTAVTLGSCLCAAANTVLVGNAENHPAAYALTRAVCAGIAAQGGTAVILDGCTLSECNDAAARVGAQLALHLEFPGGIRLFAAGGLPISRAQSEQLEQALQMRHAPNAPIAHYGSILSGAVFPHLYQSTLHTVIPTHCSYTIECSSASRRLRKLAAPLLLKGTQGTLVLQFGADGRQLSIYAEETGFVFYERLLLLCFADFLASGEAIAVPFWFPSAVESLPGAKGKILRYSDLADTPEASQARALALNQKITLDALFLAAHLLRILSESGQTLSALLATLPVLYTAKRLIATEHTSERLLRILCGKATPNGIATADQRGKVLIRPSHSGKSLRVYAEAESMEAASALCDAIEHEIQTAAPSR